jgi:hypothetical protein
MATIGRNSARAKAIADRITAQIRRALPQALEGPRALLAARLQETLNAPAVPAAPQGKPSGNEQPLVDVRIVRHTLVVTSIARRIPARKARRGLASPQHQKQKQPTRPGSGNQPQIASTIQRCRGDLQQLVKQGVASALQSLSRRLP